MDQVVVLEKLGRAALRHGALTLKARYFGHGGDDAMHVFTHTFDYIALGILIACMLGAAAVVLSRR